MLIKKNTKIIIQTIPNLNLKTSRNNLKNLYTFKNCFFSNNFSFINEKLKNKNNFFFKNKIFNTQTFYKESKKVTNIYKISKKEIFNQDNSHLHVESTDKIYPKIRKYDYNYDVSKADKVLNEFYFLYEKEDYQETLNKGYQLLNFYEINPDAKIKTIDMCLHLSEIFIELQNYENAIRLLSKAEQIFEKKLLIEFQNQDLIFQYSTKIKLQKAIIQMKCNKDKEGIILLKEALDIIKKNNLLNREKIDINTANDFLTISLYQFVIYSKSKKFEKSRDKLSEILEFFIKLRSNSFNKSSKNFLIKNILEFCEDNKSNSSYKDFFIKCLKVIEPLILDIKCKKTKDEYFLRLYLLYFTFDIKNDYDYIRTISKLDEYADVFENLLVDDWLKESAKFQIIHFKNSLCEEIIQNYNDEGKDNNYYQSFANIFMENQIKYFDTLKNRNNSLPQDSIVDNNLLSFWLSNYYQNYIKIKNSNFDERLQMIIDKNYINWDNKLKIQFIQFLNYKFLFFKDEKTLKNLNDIKDNTMPVEFEDKGFNNKGIDLKGEADIIQSKIKLNLLKELNFKEIKFYSDLIHKEKLKNLNSNKIQNHKNLKQISKFLNKEINLLMRNIQSNKTNFDESKRENTMLDDLMLKCFAFDSSKSKSVKSFTKLNKSIGKFFKLNNGKFQSNKKKLIKYRNLDDVKINLYNIKYIISSECDENSNNSLFSQNLNFINNTRIYSIEEIRKLVMTGLVISTTYFNTSEENLTKFILFFNEKTIDKNNYFKNTFIIMNNIANKRISYLLDLSAQLIKCIFSVKNESIENFLNSSEISDISLKEELIKLAANIFLLKIQTSFYFSNSNLNELINLLKENKKFLNGLNLDNNIKEEIYNKFEQIEGLICQNLNQYKDS